jgi:hypothetical protein
MTIAMVEASILACFMSDAARWTSSDVDGFEEVFDPSDFRVLFRHQGVFEVLLVHLTQPGFRSIPASSRMTA